MSIVIDQKVLNTERVVTELTTRVKMLENTIAAIEARLMLVEEYPRKPQKAKLFEQTAAI